MSESDNEPVYITIENGRITHHPETTRSKLLMLAFYSHPQIRAKLPNGTYIFNSLKVGDVTETTFRTFAESNDYVNYRFRKGPGENSLEFEWTENVSVDVLNSKYDWINPWNFFKFMAFIVFLIAWTWAAFD